MGIGHFPDDICDLYEIHEWRHASAILKHDYAAEWEHLLEMLRAFRLRESWIAEGGGNKSEVAKWVDAFLGQRGWREKHFATAVVVDDKRIDSPTHKVDCYEYQITWNTYKNNSGTSDDATDRAARR